MQAFEGYFNFYYEESNDKIYLVVDQLNKEFLYVSALAAGVGSNDIGLDRGQLGNSVVVKFVKRGNKLLLIQPNLKFRAITNNIERHKKIAKITFPMWLYVAVTGVIVYIMISPYYV